MTDTAEDRHIRWMKDEYERVVTYSKIQAIEIAELKEQLNREHDYDYILKQWKRRSDEAVALRKALMLLKEMTRSFLMKWDSNLIVNTIDGALEKVGNDEH